jgi:type II secretion system protein N
VRRLAAALVLGIVFVAAVLATLPAERIARRLLAHTPLPGGTRLAFVSASLGWRGLTLRDATWQGSAGSPLLTADRVRLRPSLRGWIRDRSGNPWSVDVALCGGDVRGAIERGHLGTVVRAAWSDVDLAPCLSMLADAPPSGMASGAATLELTPGAPHGRGTLQVRDAAWRPAGLPRHLPLDARHALLDWRLVGSRLHVDRLDLDNRELEATLTGTVEVASPPHTSRLDLLLHVVPSDDMPQAHLDAFRSLAGSRPDQRGGRRFRLAGTLGAPYLTAP